MSIGVLLVGGFMFVLGSTGAVWAGTSQQTIPTVTATSEGVQPAVSLPNGIAPIETPNAQPWAFELSNYFLPIGCCLLCCLVVLVLAGLAFNLWARRRQQQDTA